MTTLPNFKVYCEAACIKLWGEPDERTSKELRWNGANGASMRTFDLRKKKWFDYGTQRGGSTLELVAYAQGEPPYPPRGKAFFALWQRGYDQGWIPDPPPPPTFADEDPEQLLAELNRDNCVVLDGGKTWVLRYEEMEHAAGGEHYVYQVPTYLSFRAFRDFYLNRHIMVGEEKPKWVDIGSWWLHHPQRRQYRGVIFKPGDDRRVIDGKFNLWTGWGVKPEPGDWSLMHKHIFEVLAARDENLFTYIINWLAWAVQHPDLQPEVALTFLGDEGTGRGTLGKALCRIFGPHSLHISSSDHLTGRFTGHLRQCCFLFADEAYAVNDRSAEGRLKRMITEDTITIEAKRKDPREEPNCLHIMLASNHEWVVPAGAHARRFAVQKVADTHRQDAAWFGPIYKQMQNGGWEAMLFDLLHRALGNWHPRQIVRTRALSKQQEESLSALDAWWLELLQTGVLAGTDELAPEKPISNRHEKEITVRDDYGSRGNYGSRDDYGYGGGFGGGDRHKKTVWRDGLYDQARASSPKLKNATDAALGRYLNEQGCKRAWVHHKRGWKFPQLAQCRQDWKKKFPDTVWDDQKITEWKPAHGNDDDDNEGFDGRLGGCAPADPRDERGAPRATKAPPLPLTPGRARDLRDWSLDWATAQRAANLDFTTAQLEAELRMILRRELPPNEVEAAIKQVIDLVLMS